MRPKTTFILLLIAVLLGAFLWVDWKFLKDTETRTEQHKRLFPYVQSGDVTKLELHNTNGVIVVEKAGDKWDMKQPFTVRASKSEVESILSDLEFLDTERAMPAKEWKEGGATLASYGLEPPRATATFTVKDKTFTLHLGQETKLGDNLYAAVTGRDDVFVIGKRLSAKLNKTVDDLRDRTVIEFSARDLTKLELKAGNRQIELAKAEAPEGGAERWRITRPINARAGKSKIEDIADKLAGLRVESFVTEDPKDLKLYGLDEPAQEATLFTRGYEGARTVQLGAAPTNDATVVYAKRKAANSIFTVKHDIVTNLVLQVNDLRDRDLVDFDADDAKAVELRIGSQTIKLARHTNDWEIIEPSKWKAEQSACDDLVSHVGEAEIKEFTADVVTDLAQYGLDQPQFEITLHKEKVVTVTTTNEPAATATNAAPVVQTTSTTNLVPLATIQVGRIDTEKGLVFVKRTDEAFVYGLDTNFVADLPKGPLDLRDRTILSIGADDIQRLEITRAGTQFVTERVTVKSTNDFESREWKLVAPAQGVLDVNAVEDAVHELGEIKAERLVTENPPNLAAYGLEPARLTVQFVAVAGTNAPPQTHTLLLGGETPDKHGFAMLKGNPLVFEWDSAAYDRIAHEFVTQPETRPAETNAPPTETAPPQAAP
jgi:hypothetical protein